MGWTFTQQIVHWCEPHISSAHHIRVQYGFGTRSETLESARLLIRGAVCVCQISFTGSTEVGRIIAAAAAKIIKPVTLELGGKSAAIVWKDVDVDEVHNTMHWS